MARVDNEEMKGESDSGWALGGCMWYPVEVKHVKSIMYNWEIGLRINEPNERERGAGGGEF